MTVLVGIAACSGDDTYFQALLADPMAEYEPSDTELIRRSENPATSFFERGRTAPHILFEYSVLGRLDPDSVFDETVSYAKSEGWGFEGEPSVTSTGNKVYEASKDVGLPTRSELVIAMDAEENEISIRLTYPEGIP